MLRTSVGGRCTFALLNFGFPLTSVIAVLTVIALIRTLLLRRRPCPARTTRAGALRLSATLAEPATHLA